MIPARALTRAIEQTTWPALKKAGFTAFKPRVAWRFRGGAIHCVTFWCYGAQAWKYGVSGLSFGLQAGVYYADLQKKVWPRRPRLERPQGHECHVRITLVKERFQQALRKPMIWAVAKDSSNISDVVERATQILVRRALPWLDDLSNPRRAVRAVGLDYKAMKAKYGSDQYGPPHDWEIYWALAMSAGNRTLAASLLEDE